MTYERKLRYGRILRAYTCKLEIHRSPNLHEVRGKFLRFMNSQDTHVSHLICEQALRVAGIIVPYTSKLVTASTSNLVIHKHLILTLSCHHGFRESNYVKLCFGCKGGFGVTRVSL